MGREYRHLSAEERAVIQVERARGTSLRTIAGLLGRDVSTISRELSRNAAAPRDGQTYDATAAAAGYRSRRRRCVRRHKLAQGTPLYRHVHDRLVYWQWSPQQIAARLRRMYPHDPAWRVSHETIYAAIYAQPCGGLKQAMIEALRQAKPRRGVKRRTAARGGPVGVPEALRIVHRPQDVTQRRLPGHWEGDLLKGAYNRSAVGSKPASTVERKTRFVVLCKLGGCTADAAVEGFTRQMRKLPAFLRQSLTYDRGSEMALHAELARRLRLDIWFADPHAPWQRGSNENTNGLLRQYLPKGTDLSEVSQTALNDIARRLNGRPRKTLDWRTPEEAMAEELAQFSKRVALDS